MIQGKSAALMAQVRMPWMMLAAPVLPEPGVWVLAVPVPGGRRR